jgi:hypothetical protein
MRQTQFCKKVLASKRIKMTGAIKKFGDYCCGGDAIASVFL